MALVQVMIESSKAGNRAGNLQELKQILEPRLLMVWQTLLYFLGASMCFDVLDAHAFECEIK